MKTARVGRKVESLGFLKSLAIGMSALRASCAVLTVIGAQAATLEIAVDHVLGGDRLQIGSIRYENGAKENYSVTRMSYLLSDFAFRQTNGVWFELTNSVAWFDAESGHSSGWLEIANGSYSALRFSIGLKGGQSE